MAVHNVEKLVLFIIIMHKKDVTTSTVAFKISAHHDLPDGSWDFCRWVAWIDLHHSDVESGDVGGAK